MQVSTQHHSRFLCWSQESLSLLTFCIKPLSLALLCVLRTLSRRFRLWHFFGTWRTFARTFRCWWWRFSFWLRWRGLIFRVRGVVRVHLLSFLSLRSRRFVRSRGSLAVLWHSPVRRSLGRTHSCWWRSPTLLSLESWLLIILHLLPGSFGPLSGLYLLSSPLSVSLVVGLSSL